MRLSWNDSSWKRWSWRLSAALFVLGSALLLATLPAGCGDTVPGECAGLVDEAGNCVARCDPSKCLDGNVCVDNVCRLQCTSHAECFPGTQDCVPAVEDEIVGSDTSNGGRNVQVCMENGRLPVFTDGFPYSNYGFLCAAGDFDCSAQFACPNGLQCNDPQVGPPCDCQPDEAACEGFEACNVGKCSDSGEICTVDTCASSECKPFSCISPVEVADADAYCTAQDCSADSDCAAGFYCGVRRDPRDICGNTCTAGGTCSQDASITCTTDANCQKGNNDFCGNTVDECLDPGLFAENGGTYQEGGRCLLQNACLRRDQCAPCEHNLDCSLGDATACTVHAGQNVCARFCLDGADCLRDEVCMPYAGASGAVATCHSAPGIDCVDPAIDCPQIPDESAAGSHDDTCDPRSVCVPASGACDASDAPDKFCAHCIDDLDCGTTGAWSCETVNRLDKACFNRDFDIPCPGGQDSECPTAPGGTLHGTCLDDQWVDPTAPNYLTCFFPFDDGGTTDTLDDRFTCY